MVRVFNSNTLFVMIYKQLLYKEFMNKNGSDKNNAPMSFVIHKTPSDFDG
jgi:hypothetical protein